MKVSNHLQPISLTYNRISSTEISVGQLAIGGNNPIRLQTMANVSTNDIAASVAQAKRCVEAGTELLRFTTQGEKEVDSLNIIHQQLRQQGITIPLVADVHFRADVADKAAAVVEKVRINPGNYVDPARKFIHIDYTDEAYQNELQRLEKRFVQLLDICRQHHTAIRIGVNHGSLSDRIRSRYGDTAEGMVESCMEFLRVAKKQHFKDIVLSIKASNTFIMVQTVRLLISRMHLEQMAFPVHLGVTEAGEGEDGRIKSAVGIGALLAEGIGDTIRVSLSEEPEQELPVAQALRDYFTDPDSIRYKDVTLVKETDTTSKDTFTYHSSQTDASLFSLQAAAECGRLGMGRQKENVDLVITNPNFSTDYCRQLAQDIQQAAGILRYKTEFVSCPGCGRTLFDLQHTVAQIKLAFAQRSDLPPMKIAVMGCIVNGPGEMADADYGYVGAGRDKVSLYKQKECIKQNIPEQEAVSELIQLIEKDL